MKNHVEDIMAVIDHIEKHLTEDLDLDSIAGAVHYSKYHLHRMFIEEVGLTIHDYVKRRRLTEAAKLLAFSEKTILEIALSAGYESQQAFGGIFKEMYKKTPHQYREEEIFYPLQLRYVLNRNCKRADCAVSESFWRQEIAFAVADDIPQWMDLVHLVIDGYPYLNDEDYVNQLREYIDHKRALILKDNEIAIGIMLFHEGRGSIDFFGIHPQYRKWGIARVFIRKITEEIAKAGAAITVTTFREGDKADTGYRDMLKGLGFAEAELLVEFGYPTQRFILRNADPERGD